MRPLVWWVQDHLGLAALGLLGLAVVVVAVILASSGGSSQAPTQPEKVAGGGTSSPGAQGSGDGSTASAHADPTNRHRVRPAAAHHRHKERNGAAKPVQRGGADASSTKSKSHADQTAAAHRPKAQKVGKVAPDHSLDQATAEKVAAAHPATSCPKSYSKKQCEAAVEAAADPAPVVPVTQPGDCVKAMSETQCEELFAAEAAARAAAAGSVPVSVQECMEHPEQEKCTAVVEEMKAQYEAAHPGG